MPHAASRVAGQWPAHDLGVLGPALEHLDEVILVVRRAHAVVVGVRVAGGDIRLGHGDVPLARDGAVGVVGDRLRAGCGLQHRLGATVAVEVVDEELRVVGAGADVHAEVEAVEQRAVELVGVDVDGPGPAELGDVLGVRRVPLHDVLVRAVAVDVADRDVVGRVRVARALVGDDLGGVTPSAGFCSGRSW